MHVHWLQHVPFEGLGTIEPWLRARDARVTMTRLYAGETLPDPRGLDLVVAMGGPMSVNDDERLPWLTGEFRFIREAIEGGVAVLGVCLGAQLIARAMGGRVFKNAEREIGWWPITGTSDAPDVPRWARKGASNPVFHWHGETFTLPNGSERLASSPGCENQAFRIGSRVIGIQFHLETTPALVQALTTNCPEDLAPGTFVEAALTLQSHDASEYASLHGLMTETLDSLTASTATGSSTSRQAQGLA
jgi:GMP synthase-like glutamine amidotransferase